VHLERSENFARDVEPDGRTNFNLRKRHILVANGYAVTSADPAAGREDRTHGWLELVLDGWATDQGIKFQPREGQWTTASGGSAWKLTTAPATRPATVPTGAH